MAVHDWAQGHQSIDDAAGKSCTDVSSGGGRQRITPAALLKTARRLLPLPIYAGDGSPTRDWSNAPDCLSYRYRRSARCAFPVFCARIGERAPLELSQLVNDLVAC